MKLGVLRTALQTPPKKLDGTYARMFEDGRRTLSCLTCAYHPLEIEKNAETVAIGIEGERYDNVESQLKDPRDTLTIILGWSPRLDFSRKPGSVEKKLGSKASTCPISPLKSI